MDQDTSPSQLVRYHQLLRRMTAQARAATTSALCRGVREAALAGLRHRHPQATEEQLRVRLWVRLYGRAEAERVLGTVPEDAV